MPNYVLANETVWTNASTRMPFWGEVGATILPLRLQSGVSFPFRFPLRGKWPSFGAVYGLRLICWPLNFPTSQRNSLPGVAYLPTSRKNAIPGITYVPTSARNGIPGPITLPASQEKCLMSKRAHLLSEELRRNTKLECMVKGQVD